MIRRNMKGKLTRENLKKRKKKNYYQKKKKSHSDPLETKDMKLLNTGTIRISETIKNITQNIKTAKKNIVKKKNNEQNKTKYLERQQASNKR